MDKADDNDLTSFRLDIEKLTGQADEKASCGVFTGRVSFQDGTLATIVSCILVKGDKGDNKPNLIKDVFDLTNKKLEGASSGSLDALKVAGEAGSEFVAGVSEDISFCHVLFYKNVTYIFKYGDKVKVFAYEAPKSTELDFEYGSGLQKEGQLYLVATEKFHEYFDLSSHLAQKEIDTGELVDELATEVSAKSDQSEIGAAIVYIKENREGASKVSADVIDSSQEIRGEVEGKSESADEDKTSDGDKAASELLRPVPGKPEGFEQEEQVDGLVTGSAPSAAGKSRFKNHLPLVVSAINSEVRKLRRGDNKALFRLRRNIVVVAIVILLILAISAVFTIRGSQNRKRLGEYKVHFEAASQKYDEAVAILTLNRGRAREILITADNEVKKALDLMPSDDKARQLDGEISAKLKETENLATVTLKTLAEADGDLVSLAKSGKSLVAFSEGSIFKIDINSKSANKLTGKSDTKSASVYDNRAFVYLDGDVYKIDLANGAQERAFSSAKAVDIAVFLGNVYLLGLNQVFKYVPVEGGYAAGVAYLSSSEQFDEASRFAIDGSVWITKGNQILNFLRGEKKDFAISGLVNADLKLGPIFADANTDNLYVVDTQNSALLVIGKDGIYKKSYQAPEFGKSSDLVVDEKEGKMYVAVGNKVLVGDL